MRNERHGQSLGSDHMSHLMEEMGVGQGTELEKNKAEEVKFAVCE